MNREEIIKKMISDEELSLKAFAKKADIPYTTFYSMLERGIGNASVDNVIKVCKTLGITIEELDNMANNNSEGINKPHTIAAHLDGESLTSEEEQEIKKYIDFILSRRKK